MGAEDVERAPELVRRAVGRRTVEFEPTGAVIAGKLHTFEKEKEEYPFKEAKGVEATQEDIESALADSVMDGEPSYRAKRQFILRGLARCEKLLEAMQKNADPKTSRPQGSPFEPGRAKASFNLTS